MSSKTLFIVLILALIAGAPPKTISMVQASDDYATAENRIEEAIKDGRTVLDFRDLKHLTRIPENVRDIKGLWHLNAVSAKRLTDIHSLRGLPELKNLQLGDTRISDLKPLSGLKNLEVLDIRHTWVEDLQPLTQIPRLRWLQMNALGVETLCPLNDVRFLDWLNLHKSYAKDGSQKCFSELEDKVTELGGGASYKQSYIPGKPYLWKVSFGRFLEWLEWSS